MALSRSSGLRFKRLGAPSRGIAPMADFRHALRLNAYGGGSARASHPVVYHPDRSQGTYRALKAVFVFIIVFSFGRFVKLL